MPQPTQPERATTLAKIIESVAAEFMVDPAALDAATTPANVPGWDSVSQVMLLMRLEQVFGRSFDLSLLQAAPDLGALANLVAAPPDAVEAALHRFDPLGNIQIPIHPAVAQRLGLAWWKPGHRFRTGEGDLLTFETYLQRYIDFA